MSKLSKRVRNKDLFHFCMATPDFYVLGNSRGECIRALRLKYEKLSSAEKNTVGIIGFYKVLYPLSEDQDLNQYPIANFVPIAAELESIKFISGDKDHFDKEMKRRADMLAETLKSLQINASNIPTKESE